MLRVASALACCLLVLAGAAPVAAAGVAGVDGDSATAAPAIQQSEGSLSLSVTDGDDPVAGADVTLSRDGEQVLSGETADDGTLDTGPIAEGEYRVEIREPGYHEESIAVTVAGETDRSVTIDPGSVELTVTVADERTGDALADATVDVDAAGTVRTGTDGTQTVRVPVNSDVGLAVERDGYERASLSVAVDESSQSVTLEIARESDLSLALSSDSVSAGETVEGTITDAYGDPVAGAVILLDGEVVAETDTDGTASVPVDGDGEHTLRARAGSTLSEQRTLVADGAGSTPAATRTASENGTTDAGTTDTATQAATETATATPPTDDGDSPPSGLPLPAVDLPQLGDGDGPLGLPPIEGSARIVFVIAGVGAVGLVLSILREDKL